MGSSHLTRDQDLVQVERRRKTSQDKVVLLQEDNMSDLFIKNVSMPKIWSRPRSKVYDVNRVSGEFYYQPMLDYIDNKDIMGSDVDIEFRKKVEMTTLLSRDRVKLPTAQEMANVNVNDIQIGPLRLGDFISVYKAKQIKGRNQKTVHTKYEMSRGSKSSDTLPDKRSSTIIRDQYINGLVLMYRDGVGH